MQVRRTPVEPAAWIVFVVALFGIGLFYLGILAFFLYPVVKAASNAA